MDECSRELERLARVSGAPQDGAAFLRELLRGGAEDSELSSALTVVGVGMRAQTLALVENISEDRRSILQVLALMIERVDKRPDQVERALATTALFEINPDQGDIPLPNHQQVLQSIQSQLTPRQAQEILTFKEPRLVVYPITNDERYKKALHCESCRTMERQYLPYLSDFARNALNAIAQQGAQITGYRWAIVDGAQMVDVPDWDDAGATLPQRIDNFNENFQELLSQNSSDESDHSRARFGRPDYGSVGVLMMESLLKGKPLGCKYKGDSRKRDASYEWQYTLLQGIDEEDGVVGVVYWAPFSQQVRLRDFDLGNRGLDARFRLAVMGKIGL